jgi:hypothetical protein
MTMTHEEVEERAEQVLWKTDTYREPVPIELLAHRLKLTTEAASFGQDVSGMLVVENERGAIAYNSTHSHVRQRFTVAHEIAHFVLHLKKNRRSQLFIDRYVVFRRDGIPAARSDPSSSTEAGFGLAVRSRPAGAKPDLSLPTPSAPFRVHYTTRTAEQHRGGRFSARARS